MCQRHGSDQTPTLLVKSKNHVSINYITLANNVDDMTYTQKPLVNRGIDITLLEWGRNILDRQVSVFIDPSVAVTVPFRRIRLQNTIAENHLVMQ